MRQSLTTYLRLARNSQQSSCLSNAPWDYGNELPFLAWLCLVLQNLFSAGVCVLQWALLPSLPPLAPKGTWAELSPKGELEGLDGGDWMARVLFGSHRGQVRVSSWSSLPGPEPATWPGPSPKPFEQQPLAWCED